jgi:predicted phosphodiesterase
VSLAPAIITRLGVIGDVHAEDIRLELALNHLQANGVDQIICTGDVVDGIGCPERSLQLLQAHGVQTVRGNHDRWLLENRVRHIDHAHEQVNFKDASLAYLNSLPSAIELDTLKGRLLLCHGIGNNDLQKIWPGSARMPPIRSRELDRLIKARRYQYVINGHLHFRTMIHFEAMTLINAGTLKGEQWPGFMQIDFAKDTVTSFKFSQLTDNPRIELAKHLPLGPGPEHTIWRDTQAFSGDWQPLALH